MLMMSSRPIAAGFRRKNLEGCYIVGQWIVIPGERRIPLPLPLVRDQDEVGRGLGNGIARLQRTDDGAIFATAIDGSCRVKPCLRMASRILEDHGESLNINRCPRCRCVAGTPTARQYRYCGHDCHDERG